MGISPRFNSQAIGNYSDAEGFQSNIGNEMFGNISVLIPYQPDNGHRDSIFQWVKRYYQKVIPEAELCIGLYPSSPFNKCKAINAAAKQATRDIFVIADADVVYDPTILVKAVQLLNQNPWVVPFRYSINLSEQNSSELLQVEPHWPFTDKVKHFDFCNHYRGFSGRLVVIPRSIFFAVGGYDERFVGWGGEDDAFAIKVNTLFGPFAELDERVYHFWHPWIGWKGNPHAQENFRLLSLYRRANGKRNELYKLIGYKDGMPQGSAPINLFKAREKSKEDPLKIVQIAPVTMTLPPQRDGGTEKVVYELTEELVRLGHEVYLYANKGSHSSAKIIPYPEGLTEEAIPEYLLQSGFPGSVDIIHDHTFSSVVGRMNVNIPTVCTIQLPRNNPVRNPVYVSKRALEKMGNGIGSFIYNGINPEEYQYSEQKSNYLLFIGRIVPDKGVHLAIDVAEQTNHPLIIAGPKHNQEYFRKMLKPRLKTNPNITYIGAVGGQQKQDLLKNAKFVLFPSLWEEPFGLVLTEAMACGTPVLALGNGAAHEVLKDFPQFICNSTKEMASKVLFPPSINPINLRQSVIRNFTTSIMVQSYLKLYRRLLE